MFDKHFLWGIDTAMKKLRPNAKFVIYNTEFIEWEDADGLPAPPWEEVINQIELDKIEYERTQYARDRLQEYGNAEEHLNRLWDLIDSGATLDKSCAWYNFVKEIKQKYPKPY